MVSVFMFVIYKRELQYMPKLLLFQDTIFMAASTDDTFITHMPCFVAQNPHSNKRKAKH